MSAANTNANACSHALLYPLLLSPFLSICSLPTSFSPPRASNCASCYRPTLPCNCCQAIVAMPLLRRIVILCYCRTASVATLLQSLSLLLGCTLVAAASVVAAAVLPLSVMLPLLLLASCECCKLLLLENALFC